MNRHPDPNHVPVPFSTAEAEAFRIVAHAMTSTRAAQSRWSQTPVALRLKRVRNLRHLIADHAVPLAEASAFIRRRPVSEVLAAEVLPLAEACRFVERHAANLLAPKRPGKRGLPLWLAGVDVEIRREPFGVVLVIGPGNYPLLLPGVQLLQALAAGNAVLLKPGVGGTAAARALCDLLTRAGFDPQLVALLPESPAAARAAIIARPDKVLFTGSTATGVKVLAQLAPQLIPAVMELGGSDAVIVRHDADLNLVAKALVFGLTLNAGETCISPRRVFVQRSLATELEGRLAQHFRHRTGIDSPKLPPTATEKLLPFLVEALARGAHFVAGGIAPDGVIITPLILAGVSPASLLLREDVFAPILSIVTVADDQEALRLANDSPFALAGGIFSRDESAARALASQLHAGVVTINDLVLPTADARLPFGGRKRSGFGVTRGAEGLLELTTPKVVTVSRAKFRPAYDPPRPGDQKMFEAYMNLAHGRGLKARCAALLQLLRTIYRRQKY